MAQQTCCGNGSELDMSTLTGIQALPRRSPRFSSPFFLAIGIGLLLFAATYILGWINAMVLSILAVCVIAMCAEPDLAVIAVLFILYSNVAVVAYRIHNVKPVIAGSFILLLFFPAFYYLLTKRHPLVTNRVATLMMIYLIIILGSAFFSLDAFVSLSRIGTYIAEGFLLYVVILNLIRQRSTLRKTFWTLVLTGALLASMSLYQKITGNYNASFGGLAQSQLIDSDTGAFIPPKVAGPIGDRNYYGQILLVLLPLGFYLAKSESGWRKLGARIATLMVFVGVMLTYSRGAAVAVVGVLCLMWFFGELKTKHFVIAGLLFTLVVLVIAPQYIERLQSITGGFSAASSGDARQADISIRGRMTENLAALRIFLDHPIFGVGPGQAEYYISKYGNQSGLKRLSGPRRGHNMYLEEAADTGILGIGTLLIVICTGLHSIYRERKAAIVLRMIESDYLTGIMFSLFAFLLSAVFLQLAFERYFWLMMAVGGAAVHISGSERMHLKTVIN
jgi:putative inorganic carbon (HCO3(-)) transporter